jgi:hypothetical protein
LSTSLRANTALQGTLFILPVSTEMRRLKTNPGSE